MALKNRNAVRGFETDIEKNREDSNWKKVVELGFQLKSRSSQHESLAFFLIGEGKLEGYLEEWPPLKENIERAQRELAEAKSYLTLATDESGIRQGVALDAQLLLGKLNYACGAYEDALKHFKLAELDILTEKELPVRSLRIVAESFAIKGMCLEEITLAGASKYKQAEKDAETLASYSRAADLALVYLQRGGGGAANALTLRAALPRAAHLALALGQPNTALVKYRNILSAVESPYTSSLRLTIAKRLAETLTRGIARKTYKPPDKVPVPSQNSLSRRRDDHYSEGPWKPNKYAALNQFVPENEFEEAFLVVLVGEALASRDAVLSQSGEFEGERSRALRLATALAELLAVLAARWRQFQPLTESLERAMKFSFGAGAAWRQRALCALAAVTLAQHDTHLDIEPPHRGSAQWRDAVKAISICSHANKLLPEDVALRLTTANLYYTLAKIEEGIKMAEAALTIEQRLNGPLLARCYLYTGIGYQLLAKKTYNRLERDSSNESALRMLLKAVECDNNDYLAFYRLALQYAAMGELGDACDAARSSLHARAECAGAVRLIALCANTTGPATGVVATTTQAIGAGATGAVTTGAVATGGGALLYSLQPGPATLPSPTDLNTAEEAITLGKEWLATLYSMEVDSPQLALSDRDLGSTRESSRMARSTDRGTPPVLLQQRAQCWLHLAQAFLTLGRVNTAAGCVSEAAALTPCSYQVFYTRGLVHAELQEWEAAKTCFQNAVALNPTHMQSLLYLGISFESLGWLRLAERCLRSCVSLGGGVGTGAGAGAGGAVWARWGALCAARGEAAPAADALATALHLYTHT